MAFGGTIKLQGETEYRAALKQIVQFDQDMNDEINRSGYATGGEAGHYFYKAVKVAKEALEE